MLACCVLSLDLTLSLKHCSTHIGELTNMSSSSEAPGASHDPSPLPPIRRVVTGHTASGASTFLSDGQIEPYHFMDGPGVFHDVFWTDENKPKNTVEFKDVTGDHKNELVGKEGIALKVVDNPPGHNSVSFLSVRMRI